LRRGELGRVFVFVGPVGAFGGLTVAGEWERARCTYPDAMTIFAEVGMGSVFLGEVSRCMSVGRWCRWYCVKEGEQVAVGQRLCGNSDPWTAVLRPLISCQWSATYAPRH
jgi:hypothetical protein